MDRIFPDKLRKHPWTKPDWPAPAEERRERILRWTFWAVFLAAMVGALGWKLMFTGAAS